MAKRNNQVEPAKTEELETLKESVVQNESTEDSKKESKSAEENTVVKEKKIPKLSVLYGLELDKDDFSEVIGQVKTNGYKDIKVIRRSDSPNVYVGVLLVKDVLQTDITEIPHDTFIQSEGLIESLVRNATDLKFNPELFKSSLFIVSI